MRKVDRPGLIEALTTNPFAVTVLGGIALALCANAKATYDGSAEFKISQNAVNRNVEHSLQLLEQSELKRDKDDESYKSGQERITEIVIADHQWIMDHSK